MINVHVRVKTQKNIMCSKKNFIWNPATCSYKNGKCVGSIIDGSVVICDEIIKETKTVSKSTSTKAILTKCASTNFCILLAFLFITRALLIAVSMYCIVYYKKWRIMTNSEKLLLKLVHVIASMAITFVDFDFDNILVDEKSCEDILVYNISYKPLILAKSLHIRLNRIDGFIRVYDRTGYLYYLKLKDMIPFHGSNLKKNPYQKSEENVG